jgi:hypothetical protein
MALAKHPYGTFLYGEFAYGRLEIPITWIFDYPIRYGYINEAILTWNIVTSVQTTTPVVEVSIDQETWTEIENEGIITQLNQQTINSPTTLYVKVSCITTDTNNPIDIQSMDVSLDYTEFQYYAICSDGRKFINGSPAPTADLSFVSFDPATSILTISGPRIYDELYITPRIATDEEVALWKAIGAPFYDANSPVDVSIRPIMHNNGVLTASGHEIYALVQGEQKLVSRFGVNASGDVGLAIFDNSGEEVAFTGRRQDGTIITGTEGGITDVYTKTELGTSGMAAIHWNNITTGKPTTLSGYGITNAYTKTELGTSGMAAIHWNNITTGKPTTLSGYGITNAYTKLECDSLFAPADASLPETGSNAKGTWRKWADGTLECWGMKTFTSVAVTNLWGGGIYISPTQTVTWPISFAAIESANINVIARTPENFVPLSVEAAGPFYGLFYFWKPESFTYNSITVGFYAKGRWK